ncbi:MAG: hypothetical protein PHX21_03095 [bacterium]|nr:hypothetical protein [bacterium]
MKEAIERVLPGLFFLSLAVLMILGAVFFVFSGKKTGFEID